jgi:ABC-2 type transport system permease protein
MPSARAAQGIGLLLFFVMMMLGGAGPPREVMSGVMRAIGDGLLLTHAVRVLQGPWLAEGWDAVATAAVAGFLVVSAALAALTFRWE